MTTTIKDLGGTWSQRTQNPTGNPGTVLIAARDDDRLLWTARSDAMSGDKHLWKNLAFGIQGDEPDQIKVFWRDLPQESASDNQGVMVLRIKDADTLEKVTDKHGYYSGEVWTRQQD